MLLLFIEKHINILKNTEWRAGLKQFTNRQCCPVSPRVNYLSLVSVTLFKMLGTAFRCYVDEKVIIDCEKNNMLIYICVSILRLTGNTS